MIGRGMLDAQSVQPHFPEAGSGFRLLASTARAPLAVTDDGTL